MSQITGTFKNKIQGTYPLNESQRGVYMECIENPQSTMYNIPFALKLPVSCDVERFEAAVLKVISKHPAFFARVSARSGAPAIWVEDCAVAVDHTAAKSEEEAYGRFVRPFELDGGPLSRFELCAVPGSVIFLFDAHHIAFDGSSLTVFLTQISDAYDGKEIPDEDLTVFGFAEKEKALKESPEYKAAQEHFRKRFEGVEYNSEIPSDMKRPSKSGYDMLVLDDPEGVSFDDVDEISKRLGVRKNTFFVGAFAYALSLFEGAKDSCFVSVSAGRHVPGLENTVGMFVKTFPLRFEIDDEQKVSDYLAGVQDNFYETLKHDCISFGELVADYGINSNTCFVYQSRLLEGVEIGGEKALPISLPVNDLASNMTVMLCRQESCYELLMQYRPGFYTRGLVESLARTIFKVLKEMLRCENLRDITLIPDCSAAFVDEVNRTGRPLGGAQTVNELLDEVIARYPEKTVLVHAGKSYTYSQLDAVSRKVAAYVASKGISEEDFVPVLTPRNAWMSPCAWGIIRAGAAYEPLDPAYPPERLNYMVSDCKARLVIADRSLRHLLDAYDGEILYTDEIEALPEAPDFKHDAKPESALVIIYTSGTTGTPKGVVLENRNLLAFFRAHAENVGLGPDSRCASYASYGFDAGVMDIVTTPLAGAALYIVPDEIRLDLPKVEAFYCENGITHGFMTTQVGRMFAEQTKCKTLKIFFVGGEKLVPFTPPEGFRFINSYGPCETMAYVCHYTVEDNSPLQPIGKPSGNIKLYVADARGRMLPVCGIGELCISGAQVGRGYLGLPEKTAAAFVSNPFTDEPGYERMYRTGDVVRLLPDGNIEYIGRRDSQVKIRGYRVELTEVEEVVRRFGGVKDAAVTAFDDPAGGKFIAAYVAGDGPIDTDALRAFIRGEKPAYMVPAAVMQIDAIPYNQNQKVNRRALPAPVRSVATDLKKPETEAQQNVFAIAAAILGSEKFGIDTDLFDAGMTSIGTLKLNVELGKAFDAPVKISDIRDNSTVRALAKFLEKSTLSEVAPAATECPLMQNQMGVFLDCGMGGDGLQYNIPMLMKISDKLDAERLKASVCKAIDAHPFIKATLRPAEDGKILALRHDDREAVASVIKAVAIPSAKELIRPFGLLGESLYRAEIYVTPEGNYLFLDIHHIVGDGTSIAILLRDIDAAYAGKPLTTERYTGFDAGLEEEKIVASEQHGKALKYFETLLSGCSSDSLPGKCPESADAGAASFERSFGAVSGEITGFCKRNGLSQNAFFNAVFSFVLARFLHADDVTYCTIYNGRNDSRLADCFSMLVKTLPVRCTVDGKAKVLDFVRGMQAQLMGTMASDSVSFASLSEKYGLKSDLFFNYQGDNFEFDTLGGEAAQLIPLEVSAAKAPLSFQLMLRNGEYVVQADYRTECFSRELCESFCSALASAAAGFVKAGSLADVILLAEDEKQHFDRMNATETAFERIPAQTLLERYAKSHPDKVAVKTAGGSLTFGELSDKADALAVSLMKLGVAADEIVGLILNRSELVPVAELGILKAGGAFLPMLPTYPDDRLDFCMTDAGCRFVIATEDIIAEKPQLFAEGKPYKVLSLEKLIAEGAGTYVAPSISQSQMAYCIYTSGSTGTPKGVMIEHHNLCNFVQTAALCEVEAKGSAILCMASISFDMSVTEIFFSLSRGNTVYIASEEEVHNLDKLLAAFKENGIDIMMMTPSFAWNLLSLPQFESALANLKGVVLGAEAFQPVLLSKLKALNPDMLVQNGYGPTECTQVCSVKTLTEGCSITIGSPFANTKFSVADEAGNPLPRYAVGELIISGEGVCRGYIGLPEKNAAAFPVIDGIRSYRSGDLVRVNKDNEVEFAGRADNQVKLRGFRVELDEIEAVMQEFDGVSQSKVVVRNNGTEDFLAGFFTASKEISVEELTAYMKTKLTYYMVPAALMQLDKMPMTAGGKLDKKALPEIKPAKKARAKRAPKKSLEEKILELFKSVLNLDECYVDDNFFEIGGTSLSASKVVMQLKADGNKIEYQDIFDHQSAGELANYLESLSVPEKTTPAEKSAEPEADDRISKLLACNCLEYAAQVERKPLGTVLLTGATGFLGVHVLDALLENESGRIICLMRKGDFDDLKTRLQSVLVYYFESDFEEQFGTRLQLVEGDITADNLQEILAEAKFDTIINCAASVKHYAKDNSIEFVNVHGVENLIALAKAKDAKLIQISTTSVPGAHTQETYKANLKMAENKLFVIDNMNNQYCQSKHEAELLLLDAIDSGLRGKIIRVGNLMGRYSDGEFQTNMRSNAFLNGLRGFVNIGKCPISHATDPISFSPVDCTAKAIVLLAGTNDMFTAFHVESRSYFDEMKIIEALNRCGIKVTPVPDEEYYADFNRFMADPEKNMKVSALLTNDRPDMHMVEADNRFTANILYRLGFSWPFIEDRYLDKVITSLDELDFFFLD